MFSLDFILPGLSTVIITEQHGQLFKKTNMEKERNLPWDENCAKKTEAGQPHNFLQSNSPGKAKVTVGSLNFTKH